MTALGLRPGPRLGVSPRASRRPSTAFSPAQLSGLAFWYDAAQSPVVEAGGAVERWDDLSGNDNHAGQAASGQRPIADIDGAGLAVMRFDGTDDVLEVQSPPDLSAGVTLFIAFRMRTRTDFAGILAAAAATGADHEAFFTLQNTAAADQEFQLFGKSAQADTAVIKRPDSTELQYAVFTIGTSAAELRDLNGAATDTTTSLALGVPAAIVLGGRYNDGAPFSFSAVDIYEVGLYDRVLGSIELDQLETYLRLRRGLTWNPMHLGADLRWYHDVDDSAFTLDGGLVDQWHDRTAAARDWSQTGTPRPDRTTDDQDRHVVRFDGTEDVMTMAGTLPALEPFSVAIVYRVRTRSNFAGLLSAAPASGADHTDFWTFQNASEASNEMQLSGRSLESDQLTLTRPDANVAQIAIWTASGGTAELRDKQGAVTDTYDGGFGTPDQIVVGGRYDGAPFGFGAIDVFATVGVGRVLSAADQQKLIDWATIKWGIA